MHRASVCCGIIIIFGYQLKAGHDQGLPVRPELVEACPEPLCRGGERLSRSWFDKALLSVVEGLPTNGLTCTALSWYPLFSQTIIKLNKVSGWA